MNKSDLFSMEAELHTLISEFFYRLISDMEYAEAIAEGEVDELQESN